MTRNWEAIFNPWDVRKWLKRRSPLNQICNLEAKTASMQERYPTELTDNQWQLIGLLFPVPRKIPGGARASDKRFALCEYCVSLKAAANGG